MNSDRVETRDPHLDLGDLVALAAGQAVVDRAREHLAGCEPCQVEAGRWNVVAEGVRGLAAAAPEPAPPVWAGRPPGRGRPVWRRALLVASGVAAAVIFVVGIGAAAGLVHVRLSGSRHQTVLSAVTGCSQLEQAEGTLEQVNASSIVIETAGGRPATVTTTPATLVSVSGPLLGNITDGATVMVRGDLSQGTIQAAIVTVGEPFSAVNPPGFVPVQGTVSDSSAAGFTLVTPTGTPLRVTTSSTTLVVVPHASPAQLPPGARIFALGHPGPDGTLSATAVAAVSQPRSGRHLSVSLKDCSTTSIVEALGAVSQASPNS